MAGEVDPGLRALVERMLALAGSEGSDDVASVVHPEVSIDTGAGVVRGIADVSEWSGKRFAHLDRRYRLLGINPTDSGARVEAALEYVWRESGEIADSQQVEIEISVEDGRVSSWRMVER